jgi:PAS domain S-box-containing protein
MSTILIAYEREMEQNALEKLLSERGHAVIRSNNGVEALDIARRESPQLIISDIVLPKMDGFALLKKWKQDDHLQRVPFVFYTRRHDDPKYERFALELGTDRYVERSTDPSALYKAVDDMLAEGAVARHADTQRLQALSTGSFTATTRIATAQAAPELAKPSKPKQNGQHAPAQEPVAATAAPTESKAPAIAPTAAPASAAVAPSVVNDASAEDRSLAREARLMARVTELDALNKQLQASEQRFRQLFEASPIPLWLINSDDRNCTHVNQAALTLYGTTREGFLALPRTSPPFVPGAAIAETSATWHRTQAGNAIAVELTTRVIELGTRRSEIVAAHDVTQRVFSQQATAHAAEAYQALLVAAVDGFWLLDAQQRLLDVNEAYCKMSGYGREELLKLSPAELELRMPAESSIRLQQRLASAQTGGSSTYETMHRRKNGAFFPVEVSIGTVTGARARSVAIIREASATQAKMLSDQQHAKAQAAALELFNQAANLDESGLARRATELCASVTSSPLAFFAGSDVARPALLLTAVYEQNRGVAVAVTNEARKLSPQGPSAQCLRSGQPLIVDASTQGESAASLPTQHSLLITPISSAEERIGVLAVANRSTPYSEHDQKVLAPIAQALGSILQIKRSQAQTLVSAQRADIALQGIIEGLSRVVERHDPHTTGGPRRVAALAVAIARELDLTTEQQDALRTAGLLHGVGNIAIPAALLSKPSSLTAAELALVRTHVEEGCKILSEIQFGSPVSEIVYQHHERMDGSGYPRGLRGDAILLEARVLAVADVIEAMCASRPHRPAPGLDAALAEIEKGAGRIYDAKVSTVCLRLFRENGYRLPE